MTFEARKKNIYDKHLFSREISIFTFTDSKQIFVACHKNKANAEGLSGE
jgi:hypothetical protein